MKKWEINKSVTVYENKYFSVVEEDFRLSSGALGKYYLVRSLDFVAIIATEGEYVYMEKVDRYALRKRIIEIPMGGVEEGETPLQAAKRELKEETGIAARRYKKLGYIDASKGRSNNRGIIFVAEDLSFGQQQLDTGERESNLEVCKMKISEISELIRRGKITDSHTIAAFTIFMLNYKGRIQAKS